MAAKRFLGRAVARGVAIGWHRKRDKSYFKAFGKGVLVVRSSAWLERDNAESADFERDKACGRSTASGKSIFGFLIALSENRAILVFFASMMVLVVFLAGINVLYVLGAAVRAAFSGVVIDLYFLRTTVVVLFAKTDVLTLYARNNYARVILVANLCVDAKQLAER